VGAVVVARTESRPCWSNFHTANMASSPASRETREQSPDWPPLSEEPIGSEMFNPAEIEPRARWLKISSGGCVSLNCS
jgi:hypothetical protein